MAISLLLRAFRWLSFWAAVAVANNSRPAVTDPLIIIVLAWLLLALPCSRAPRPLTMQCQCFVLMRQCSIAGLSRMLFKWRLIRWGVRIYGPCVGPTTIYYIFIWPAWLAWSAWLLKSYARSGHKLNDLDVDVEVEASSAAQGRVWLLLAAQSAIKRVNHSSMICQLGREGGGWI